MRETERERLLMMRSFQLTINATNKQNNIRSESSQLPSFSHQRRPLPFTTTTKGTCSTISYRSVQPSETLLKAPRATQKNKQTNLTPHTIATSVAWRTTTTTTTTTTMTKQLPQTNGPKARKKNREKIVLSPSPFLPSITIASILPRALHHHQNQHEKKQKKKRKPQNQRALLKTPTSES